MTERLTTLAAVKAWLSIDNDGSDSSLTRLIDAASRFALNYMNRDGFAAQEYTQRFNGNGKQSQLLRNWPILSILSVGIAGTNLPASTFSDTGLPTDGFSVSDERQAPQSVDLKGYRFWYRSYCQVVYRFGFETAETSLVPTPTGDPLPTVVTLTPSKDGQWIGDLGVTIDGIAATLVTGVPVAGEYAVDEWGAYTFAADDADKTAVISYSYAPWDVAQGVTEIIGEWYSRRDRIGVKSKQLGGQETVTFTLEDLNDSVRGMLQPYRNVIPV